MSQTEEKKGIGRRVQAFGSFLSSMIMPNIGAFIAWGFIAAIFIDNGWLPNKDLATLAGPMITYLIPLLIAFSGGRLIYDLRGVSSQQQQLWGSSLHYLIHQCYLVQ